MSDGQSALLLALLECRDSPALAATMVDEARLRSPMRSSSADEGRVAVAAVEYATLAGLADAAPLSDEVDAAYDALPQRARDEIVTVLSAAISRQPSTAGPWRSLRERLESRMSSPAED